MSEPLIVATVLLVRHQAGESMSSLGKTYGITRERVRQLIEQAEQADQSGSQGGSDV